jgi:tRNA1(Val) A37 N6-methylase TrmN6
MEASVICWLFKNTEHHPYIVDLFVLAKFSDEAKGRRILDFGFWNDQSQT